MVRVSTKWAAAYTSAIAITGAGTNPTRPVANTRNAASKPETGRPSVNSSAAPRAMLIVPSVTMNGGRPPQLINAPFPRPQTPPASSASVSASAIGWPPCSELPSTTPASATIDPTERSIPPERITNVMPTATIALMLVCSTTLTRFETVRK